MINDERISALILDNEQLSRNARLQPSKRYYADLAALARMVLEARALVPKWRARAQLHRKEIGFLAAGQALSLNYCAADLSAILNPKEPPR